MVYVYHAGKTWGAYDMETLQRHVNDRKFLASDLANIVGTDSWQPINTIASFPVVAQQASAHNRVRQSYTMKKIICVVCGILVLALLSAVVAVGFSWRKHEAERQAKSQYIAENSDEIKARAYARWQEMRQENAKKRVIHRKEQLLKHKEQLTKLRSSPIPVLKGFRQDELDLYDRFSASAWDPQFKNLLEDVQAERFPKLRDSYVKECSRLLWIKDGKVQGGGAMSKTLTLIHASFVKNSNIAEVHEGIRDTLKNLRFTRVEYKWFKEAVDYEVYSIRDVPNDSDIVR